MRGEARKEAGVKNADHLSLGGLSKDLGSPPPDMESQRSDYDLTCILMGLWLLIERMD